MHDVIIIGAGVIGASIARQLSSYNLKVALLEKDDDVTTWGVKSQQWHSSWRICC